MSEGNLPRQNFYKIYACPVQITASVVWPTARVLGRAFRFAKNNFDSIRFTPEKSIRIDSSDSICLHMAVTQEVGGRGAA